VPSSIAKSSSSSRSTARPLPPGPPSDRRPREPIHHAVVHSVSKACRSSAGPDHIGFHVETSTRSSPCAAVAGMNPYLAPVPLAAARKSDVRRRFFEKHANGQMANERSRRQLDRHHRRVSFSSAITQS